MAKTFAVKMHVHGYKQPDKNLLPDFFSPLFTFALSFSLWVILLTQELRGITGK